MSSRKKAFRHSIMKKYSKQINLGVFRYGKLMDRKYAVGYCNNHNCLICRNDIRCKACNRCKYFTENLVNSV